MAHQQNTNISTIDKANKKRRTLPTELLDQYIDSVGLRLEYVGDASSNSYHSRNDDGYPNYTKAGIKSIFLFELGHVPEYSTEYYSGPYGGPNNGVDVVPTSVLKYDHQR